MSGGDREIQLNKARDLRDTVETCEEQVEVIDNEIAECDVDLRALHQQLKEIRDKIQECEQFKEARLNTRAQVENTLEKAQVQYLKMLEATPCLLGVLKRK